MPLRVKDQVFLAKMSQIDLWGFKVETKMLLSRVV